MRREEARLDPFDRGFIFGEGIYEGLRSISWKGGCRIVGLDLHVRRMRQGLKEAGIAWDAGAIGPLSEALVRANGLTDAFVYWQVTGGAPVDGDPVRHRFPPKGASPTVFGYCEAKPSLSAQTPARAIRVITAKDIRWELGWVKSISLMGNVWLARKAEQAGADEAILLRDGMLAEGLATNVILAIPDGRGGTEVVTPSSESAPMLAGVTRDLLLRWAPDIRQRAIRHEELERATEVMLTGTSMYVAAVVEIDGRPIGDGAPGPVARRLHKTLLDGYLQGRDVPRSEDAR